MLAFNPHIRKGMLRLKATLRLACVRCGDFWLQRLIAKIEMPISQSELELEATTASDLLVGKNVAKVFRPKASTLGVEFSDGTRLFIDAKSDATIELSITGGL